MPPNTFAPSGTSKQTNWKLKTLIIEVKWSPIRIGPLGTGRRIKSRCLDAFGWKICRAYVDQWMPLLMVSTSPCLQVEAEKSIYKCLDAYVWKKSSRIRVCMPFVGSRSPGLQVKARNSILHASNNWINKTRQTIIQIILRAITQTIAQTTCSRSKHQIIRASW